MKDATTELRKSYIALLADIGYPVYSDEVNDTIAPYTRDNPPKQYIILSNQSNADLNIKQKYQSRHTIQVDCVTIYPAYNGSSLASETMADQVLQRIVTDYSNAIPITGFNCYKTNLDLSRQQDEKTKVANYYKRILIFSHYIEQI